MAPDKKSRVKDEVHREYTIHLHKRIQNVSFKKRAPRAVKEIKKFAQKAMKTKDVRVDVKLNKAVWSRGIRNVPVRLRVVIQRRRNFDKDAKDEMYSIVRLAESQEMKGKGTTVLYQ